MIDILSTNKAGFVEIIMVQKLGLQLQGGSPLLNSNITFLSFTLFGFIPLIPLMFYSRFNKVPKETFVLISGVITMVTLFILGFSKSRIVKSRILLHLKQYFWESLLPLERLLSQEHSDRLLLLDQCYSFYFFEIICYNNIILNI